MSGLAIAARALEQQRELQADRIHALEEASAATPTLVDHLREQLALTDREIRALRSAVDSERDEELPLSAHGPALEQTWGVLQASKSGVVLTGQGSLARLPRALAHSLSAPALRAAAQGDDGYQTSPSHGYGRDDDAELLPLLLASEPPADASAPAAASGRLLAAAACKVRAFERHARQGAEGPYLLPAHELPAALRGLSAELATVGGSLSVSPREIADVDVLEWMGRAGIGAHEALTLTEFEVAAAAFTGAPPSSPSKTARLGTAGSRTRPRGFAAAAGGAPEYGGQLGSPGFGALERKQRAVGLHAYAPETDPALRKTGPNANQEWPRPGGLQGTEGPLVEVIKREGRRRRTEQRDKDAAAALAAEGDGDGAAAAAPPRPPAHARLHATALQKAAVASAARRGAAVDVRGRVAAAKAASARKTAKRNAAEALANSLSCNMCMVVRHLRQEEEAGRRTELHGRRTEATRRVKVAQRSAASKIALMRDRERERRTLEAAKLRASLGAAVDRTRGDVASAVEAVREARPRLHWKDSTSGIVPKDEQLAQRKLNATRLSEWRQAAELELSMEHRLRDGRIARLTSEAANRRAKSPLKTPGSWIGDECFEEPPPHGPVVVPGARAEAPGSPVGVGVGVGGGKVLSPGAAATKSAARIFRPPQVVREMGESHKPGFKTSAARFASAGGEL